MADIPVISPNGEQGTIPEENLAAAKAAGFTQPDEGTATAAPEAQAQVKAEDIGPEPGTYNVVAPDGTKGTVPTAGLPSALASGFKLASVHAVTAEHDARVNYWVNDLKNGIATGHVSTFLRGYADEFLAGGAQKAEDWLAQKLFPTTVEEGSTLGLVKPTPDQEKENAAFAEAVRKVNEEQSTTHGAGAVAGFLGQTYLGSKMAAGVGKYVAPITEQIQNPILQAAAKEAIAGQVTMAPQAAAQLIINKDPQAAAESILVGAGTGAILGAGLKLGSQYFGKAAAQGENAAAANIAGDTANLPGVKEDLNTTEKLLLDHLGLTRGMRRNIGDAEDQRRILRILAKELGEGDVEAGTAKMASLTKEDLAKEVTKLTAENGPKIGNFRKEMDKLVETNPDALRPPVITIAMDIEKLKDGLFSTEEKNVVDHAVKTLMNHEYEATGKFKDFTEADKAKTYFRGRVDWRAVGADKAPNRVAANVARIVREHIEQAANDIATSSGNPKIIEDWNHVKTLYGVGKTLDLAAENTLNAPITHEFIPGGHGALGAGYLGHVVGGAVGIPVVGPILGVVGAKLLKNYLREGGIAKAAVFLGGHIKDPMVHSYVAVDAMKSISEKMDEIPRFVKSLMEAGAVKAVQNSTKPVSNSIKEALGEEANGLSKEQQFKRLTERLAFMQGNPEAKQQLIHELTEGFAQHHPDLATDLSMAMAKKMEYLYNILPKNPTSPQPFQHDTEWKPSAAQMHDFQKQLAVANDPFHVMEELKAGTLSASQVATLAVINPDILQKMRNEVIKLSQEKNVKLDYQQRLTMGVLLGEKLDAGLTAIPGMMPPPAPQQGQPKPSKAKKPTIKSDHLPDYRLSFQKAIDKNA